MSFTWASEYPDLQLVCKTFGRYEIDDPDRYSYRIVPSVTQQGPQCGIVALAMMCVYTDPDPDDNGKLTEMTPKEKVQEILAHAQKEGMTNLGEMFSVDFMCTLAMRYLPNTQVEIYAGPLDDGQVVEFLFNGGSMLVPYDCDKNHTPCKKRGKSAHWAIVFGIVESYAGLFVVAKQGKSLNVHIWDLVELAESNQQLIEYENEKTEFGYKYVIPEGGMGGLNGLSNRALFIYPSDNANRNCFNNNNTKSNFLKENIS